MSSHLRFISLLKRLPTSHTQINRSIIQTRSFYTRNVTSLTTLRSGTHGRMLPTVLFQKSQTKLWTSTAVPKKEEKEERIIYNNWLDHLPAKIAPYAFLTRIDKPIGTWLLFWPCGKSPRHS